MIRFQTVSSKFVCNALSFFCIFMQNIEKGHFVELQFLQLYTSEKRSHCCIQQPPSLLDFARTAAVLSVKVIH